MNTIAMKAACHDFAKTAAPYLHIQDNNHYEESLALLEDFLQEVEDSPNDPLNSIIDMLSYAIETYENSDKELAGFEAKAMQQPSDLAVLRLLMDQYNLGVSDLPEIGSKSMVSRVLSGERKLNKNHVEALSKRFNIDPGLFF